jgi:3-phenylpropionate/trans-cinnamate dioxygenase ferredoxin reductase subunit
MARDCQITIDGTAFSARQGDLVLDAALNNGVDLPFDCRAGHCGTCCVRLVSGHVEGGEGATPGVVHACQCRIVGDAVFERDRPAATRTVHGVVGSVRYLSSDIVEVGIKTNRALPYLAGQYAKIAFDGYPARPFSLTLPIEGDAGQRSIWFHIRQMPGGRVTPEIGGRIRAGHRVQVMGPYGSAYFRSEMQGRLILVATNTGFAPIWSIAVSALRENPYRMVMVIVGARTVDSLYMGPALVQLARFPNVRVLPVCSTPQTVSSAVWLGRPTDYMPSLFPTDVVYACGAAGMVAAIQHVAAHAGAACHADPFLPTSTPDEAQPRALSFTRRWLVAREGNNTPPPRKLPRQRRQPLRPASLLERG